MSSRILTDDNEKLGWQTNHSPKIEGEFSVLSFLFGVAV